jgi:hypothetical protein
MNTRKLRIIAVAGAMLAGSLTAFTARPAEAVTAGVAARLVCGTNARCYVENPAWGHRGGVPYGAPCYHVRNVSYGIGSQWNTETYSFYRGTQCSKTQSRF